MKECDKTLWVKYIIRNSSVMKTKVFIIVLLTLLVSQGPAHAFFGSGSSGPNPNLEKIKAIRTEILASTEDIWKGIDKQVNALVKEHQALLSLTTEQINAMTLEQLLGNMEKRQAWGNQFDELTDFLKHEYNQFPIKITGSDIPPPFKDQILKHYSTEFSDNMKKSAYAYLRKSKAINDAMFNIYKMIATSRFPKELKTSNAPETFTEDKWNMIRNALPEKLWLKVQDDRKDYDSFISHFYFDPIEDSVFYQAATQLFKRDPARQKALQNKFVSTYFSDGIANAELELKFMIIPTLNTDLPAALPKASGDALVKFASENMEVLKGFYSSSSGADTKFCLVYADAKEFVGIDYNQILNMYFHKEAPWRVGFFEAVNDILQSSQTAPGDYESKNISETEQLLFLAKKSASTSVSQNPWYQKLLGKNKYSPRRFCFLRYTLLDELLKLPSPSKEDALRLLYTNEAAVKPVSTLKKPKK